MKLPSMPNFKGLVGVGKTFVMANRPEILFGAAVTATLAAVGLSAKGGYDARGILEEHASENNTTVEDIPVKEKIQLTWLCYMPAAVTTVGAVGSVAGLHIVHVKEKKQLAAAALAAIEEVKTEAKQYAERIEEAVDKNVTQETREAIRDDAMDPDGDGKTLVRGTDAEVEELYLVRDGKTGRDIWSNQARIEEAVLNVNNFLTRHGDCDLNSFYSNAGFELLPDGDDWGWSGDFIELKWDEVKRDDGRPVRRFVFRQTPEKGYDRPVS